MVHNTPLGKWTTQGHQRWNSFCDESGAIMGKMISTRSMNSFQLISLRNVAKNILEDKSYSQYLQIKHVLLLKTIHY